MACRLAWRQLGSCTWRVRLYQRHPVGLHQESEYPVPVATNCFKTRCPHSTSLPQYANAIGFVKYR